MTQSTGSEAPAEAATDAPTGSPAQPHPTLPDGFGELDRRAIDTARVLAMDAVQKVGNGHPGTAMSMAPDRLPALPEVAAARPQRPELGRPRPVRAVDGPLEPDPLRPALPLRLRPGARRPRGAAHLGLADPGPPRGQPHPRRRDDDRPAGPGRRQRRRHGDGRPPRARPVRPRRPRGREPVRPHHLGASPPTATWRRASAARRPRWPAPSSWATSSLVYDDNQISIEDDTEHRLHRGRRQALRGLRLARPARATTARTSPPSTPRSPPPRPRPAARRSSCCARSSAGPRRTSRTPAPRTAPRSARTRSQATKEILGFDPEKTFDVAAEVIEHARKVVDRGQEAHADWQERFDAWQQGNPDGAALLERMTHPHAARGLGREAARAGTPTRRASPPARPPARCSPRSTRCSPSCGAARPTWPRATTPRSRANRRSCPPTARPRCGPAARTAARCTSASASTPWARS